MAFNSDKSPGDLIKSQDWDDFVDFAEAISSNSYRFSSNANKLYLQSGGTKWVDLTDSGDTTLHIHDSRYYTETESRSNFAGSSNINRLLLNTISSNLDTRIDSLYNFSSASRGLYANSSQINRTLLNNISSNLDTRIDSIFNYSSNAKKLYADSGNVRYRFPGSSAAASRYYPSSLGHYFTNSGTKFYSAYISASRVKDLFDHTLYVQSSSTSFFNSELDLTTLLNDNYAGSSQINRALLNSISSNIDSRVDSLFNWSSNKSLYANSSNVRFRFPGSSNVNRTYIDTVSGNIRYRFPGSSSIISRYNASGKIAGLNVSKIITPISAKVLKWDVSNNFWSAQADLTGGGGGGTSSWVYLNASTGLTPWTDNTRAVSGQGAALSLSILGYTTISTNAAKGYLSGQKVKDLFDHTLYKASSISTSDVAWSGASGYYSVSSLAKKAYGSGQRVKDLFDHTLYRNSSSIWGYVSSNGTIKANKFIGCISSTTMGLPTDGSLTDGCLSWTASTKTVDALDEVNELLSELAPADAASLAGKVLICNNTAYSGRLASGSSTNWTYETGYGPSSSVNYIFHEATYKFNANGVNTGITFNKADEGTLVTLLNSTPKSSISLSGRFNESNRGASQTYTPIWSGGTFGSTRILSVGKYNNFRKWQVGSGQINITGATALRKGYNYIYLYRGGLTTPVSSAVYKLWYDPTFTSTPALIAIPKIVQSTKYSKYLSGVEHYYLNSIFNVTCSSQQCFNDAWRTDKTVFQLASLTAAATATIAVDNSYCVKVGTNRTNINRYPCTGDTIGVYNYPMTLTTASQRSIVATVTATCYNAHGNNGGVASASEGRLIDTYPSGVTGTSDDWNEYFDDEWYRLPSGTYSTIPTRVSGSWNSLKVLGMASAQIYNGTLIAPTLNFSTGYLPTGGPNYSTATLPVVLFRVLRHTGTPHTNGKIELEGLVAGDVGAKGAGNVNVEIKLPSQTGWLDLGKAYSAGTFTGADGDGCQTAQSGDGWNWTSGTFTTTNSGYMILVKVTLRVNKTITRIREEGWQGL